MSSVHHSNIHQFRHQPVAQCLYIKCKNIILNTKTLCNYLVLKLCLSGLISWCVSADCVFHLCRLP